MNGIHDVGGADGFGPIDFEDDEPIFHAAWERSVFAFLHLIRRAGYYNLDEFRASIERMPPAAYLTTTYYQHWLHAFEEYLVRADPAFMEELNRRTTDYFEHPETPLPQALPSTEGLADYLLNLVREGDSARRAVDRPAAFAVGESVRVSSTVPVNHTRKPGYVRGAVGEITASWGAFAFPDTSALQQGECPDYVYTVRFNSEDLYGAGIGDPTATVLVDLWESYLLPTNNNDSHERSRTDA
jgi:nitrile hydratase beta subunit